MAFFVDDELVVQSPVNLSGSSQSSFDFGLHSSSNVVFNRYYFLKYDNVDYFN